MDAHENDLISVMNRMERTQSGGEDVFARELYEDAFLHETAQVKSLKVKVLYLDSEGGTLLVQSEQEIISEMIYLEFSPNSDFGGNPIKCNVCDIQQRGSSCEVRVEFIHRRAQVQWSLCA